ncbi:MAG: orotate phosphoribosyltransferase [Planctomycetota bacterium]
MTYCHATPTPRQPDEPLDTAALARAVAELSLLRGTFTLRSGRTSSYYLDKYLFSTKPEVLGAVAQHLAARLAGIKPDRLAGAELGGIPLVTAASLATGVPCLFVRNQRKDYGTAKRLEGTLKPGQRTVLIEDVVTTGGQAVEAVHDLRNEGAIVEHVIAVIDREEGGAANFAAADVAFEALLTKTDMGIDDE